MQNASRLSLIFLMAASPSYKLSESDEDIKFAVGRDLDKDGHKEQCVDVPAKSSSMAENAYAAKQDETLENKANDTSDGLAPFDATSRLEEYEELFKNRYTDADEDYANTATLETMEPVMLQPWPPARSNHGDIRDRNFTRNRYNQSPRGGGGSRYQQRWHSPRYRGAGGGGYGSPYGSSGNGRGDYNTSHNSGGRGRYRRGAGGGYGSHYSGGRGDGRRDGANSGRDSYSGRYGEDGNSHYDNRAGSRRRDDDLNDDRFNDNNRRSDGGYRRSGDYNRD